MATIYSERFESDGLASEPPRQVGAHVFHRASYPPMRSRGIFMCGVASPTGLCEVERLDAPFHAVVFSLAGEAELFDGKASWTLAPGDCGVMPALRHGGFRRTGDATFRHVWFLLRDEPRWQHLYRPQPYVLAGGEGASLWDAVSWLQREAQCHNEGETETLVVPVLDLVARLLERALGRQRQQDGWAQRLQRVFAEVAAQPGHDWPVAELAARLGVAHAHLHRLCLQHYGQSPGQKVLALRMQRARELLVTGVRVGDVAAAVGYQEVASFSRRFRQHHGVVPSAIAGLRIGT
ncbi:AraC family transcriptional regulator [Chitinolyticbacter albus]|uniref:AraC family transcriptional regulator n=1 Tax=Chitinolyticbacter albus TaxID=2961951 RepID=UPI002108C73B|nr:AraC family transcriptional regulator [Chitinolyticbacter albus]